MNLGIFHIQNQSVTEITQMERDLGPEGDETAWVNRQMVTNMAKVNISPYKPKGFFFPVKEDRRSD